MPSLPVAMRDALLRRYPHERTRDLAAEYGLRPNYVRKLADNAGVRKDRVNLAPQFNDGGAFYYLTDVMGRVRDLHDRTIAIFYMPEGLRVVRVEAPVFDELMQTSGQWLVGVYYAWKLTRERLRDDLLALANERREGLS